MESWDEIRTAYHVARVGTVSGAAEALGVHHATVIRHVDALERRLGVKLFQRHARGYTPTEAGSDLLRVAQATDDQFAQLLSRVRGRGGEVEGEFVVTSLTTMSPLLTPALVRFRRQHPALVVRYLTGDRVFRLEYGEAHVAVRAGTAPDEPDNVVRALGRQPFAMFASADYVRRLGKPVRAESTEGHHYVGSDNRQNPAPFNVWMRAHVPDERVVFRTADNTLTRDAILAGAGIGFMAETDAAGHPDLVRVADARDDWAVTYWVVTHVDLHRTAKVQTFLAFLRDETRGWGLID